MKGDGVREEQKEKREVTRDGDQEKQMVRAGRKKEERAIKEEDMERKGEGGVRGKREVSELSETKKKRGKRKGNGE